MLYIRYHYEKQLYIMLKTTFFSIIFILFFLPSNAQLEEVFAARDDAATYVKQYLNPAMNGIMYNLNNGWYSTGKTHKKLGFDITISASAAIIPDQEKMFQFIASDYNYLSISSGSSELPTIAGGTTNTELVASSNGDSITFGAIDGAGDEWPEGFFIPVSVPTPMVQMGLGLPMKTDLKVRFFPNTNRDGVSYNLIGLGVQHNLSQHFKALDKIPTLTISGLGAFTRASIVYSPNNTEVSGSNQRIEMKINSYTLQAIGDLDLKVVNFYLGMGFTAGNTNLDALGTYQFDFDDNGNIDPADEEIVDPIQLEFAVSGFKTTLGARVNLGPVKIFGDYSIQDYSSITLGVAFSLR